MKRLALWWLRFAAVVAGWGADESDELSLLQLTNANQHTKQRLHRREAAHSVHSVHPVANLSTMITLVSVMERRHGHGNSLSGSWGDDERTALETLKSALEDQFTPYLDEEERTDINEFNTRRSVHQICVSRHAVDDASVAAMQNGLDAKGLKHRACRKSQKSWNTYLAMVPSSCAEASDISLHEVYDNHVNFASSISTVVADAEAYSGLAVDGVTGKRDCTVDQTAYETQWCAWSAAKDVSCPQLRRCLGAVGLAAVITSIQTRAENRQMLWDTVRQLLCRIQHLLSAVEGDEGAAVDEAANGSPPSDFSTDDTCDELEEDTIKYFLSLDIPQVVSCVDPGDVIKPTQLSCSAWTAQQYSTSWPPSQTSPGGGSSEWMPPSSHVVPACGQNCPESPVAGDVHPGCPEDAAGCRFYNAHAEACGSDDTGSDVQSTDCCACKPPCDAVTHCSGHGTTTDLDNTNGCECECDEGFEGSDCGTSSASASGDLVVFDNFEVRLTVSPGTLSGVGDLSWWANANSDYEVVAAGEICGMSFKCNTAETQAIIGLAHRSVGYYTHIAYGVNCRGRSQSYTDPFEHGGHRTRVLGRPGNGNPTTDVHAIRINEGGHVEYSINDGVYYTSSRLITYPWHVAVSAQYAPSLADVQYLQC